MKKLIASAAALLMLLAGLVSLHTAADAAGSAPVAANLELKTYRGVSVGGQLAAFDPDGGDLSFDLFSNELHWLEKGDTGLLTYAGKSLLGFERDSGRPKADDYRYLEE